MPNYKFTCILIISLFYLTISLACAPVAFRTVNIFGFAIVGSGLIYSSLYTMLDMLTYLCGRRFVYFLIITFHFFDLIFLYTIYGISLLPYPTGFQHYTEIDMMFSYLPRLFWGGIIGAIFSGFVEVSLYSFFQSKTKNFFKASWISTMVVIFAHNVSADYFSFNNIFHEHIFSVIMATFVVCCASLIPFSLIGHLALKIIRKKIGNETFIYSL